MTADFLTRFTSELVMSGPRRYFDNVDRVRFPEAPKADNKIRLLKLAARLGFYRAPFVGEHALTAILDTKGLDRTYGLLADEASRDLFVKLLAYRALGHEHVRLPLNTKSYWDKYAEIQGSIQKRNVITGLPLVGTLDEIRFEGVRLNAHPMGIMTLFVLEQYRCPRAGIGVKTGDVAVDGGACWGDSSIYFAKHAEHVYAFECMPSNLKIMQTNLEMNPDLAQKVTVYPKAIWDRPGEKLIFLDSGPGSTSSGEPSGIEVETGTIDDLVPGPVDFIKMDIEGAEPRALAGAEQTIRRDKPQLAISVYHDVSHFASIPAWIDDLGLGYKFYLDHFTIHAEETVLFARAD